MALVSPLYRFHQQAEASLTAYGPEVVARPEGSPGEASAGGVLVEIVETFGQLDVEYAALRKSCVVIDQPNRAVLEVTGGERVGFLNRMLTQELKGLGPGDVRRSFWLSRKGRVDGDLRVMACEDRVLLEVDVHAAARTCAGLGAYVISEDVEIRDVTGAVHRLAFHGPGSAEVVAGLLPASGEAIRGLRPGRACEVRLGGAAGLVFREDSTGEAGMELILPLAEVVGFYQRAVELFGDDDRGEGVRLRPAGWHAFNVARIEAGTPLYNLDFGVESLPAETGVLHDRVSFTKGCYLGQEIVARMQARRQLKQQLVAVRFEPATDPATGIACQAVTGATLYASAEDGAKGSTTAGQTLEEAISGDGGGGASSGGWQPVGVVTSSAISPMLGAIPIAFAQVKSSHAAAGTRLVCGLEGTAMAGGVRDSLCFWRRA